MPPASATSYGQVIEYIQDRLYLASYTHEPNESTPFPYPTITKSPSKRSTKSQHGPVPVVSRPKVHPPVYFTVDETLLYNRFHADFGPLHIGHLYRFAVQLHEILGAPENTDRGVVFWSKADSKSRANAACLLACYMVLIQSWPPHLALAPIAQADPPLMPFRDAGYSQADYGLSVQDVVYGVWKAKEEGLCGLKEFNLEEYERFERVDMGDFNWITPDFLAFASPQHEPVEAVPTSSALYSKIPKDIASVEQSELPLPFKNVLCHFSERNIGLVVRLNSELYCPTFFTALGINHLDMIFDDGTCPNLTIVRKFIKLSHDMIKKKKRGIAVHCKAGLGRTGCLIGAYLIYRYGFTANELIAFMRFMRPGMVVGPQQHWLHLNQGTFREWWWEDSYKEKLALIMPSTPTKTSRRHLSPAAQTATPPNASQSSQRSALGEINHNATAMDECLPAPTPGQPRKTSRMQSPGRGQARGATGSFGIATDADLEPEAKELVEVRVQRRSDGEQAGETAEEWLLRSSISRRTSSRSPATERARAISYTTTTTTTRYSTLGAGNSDDTLTEVMSDIENWTSRDAGVFGETADDHRPIRPKTPASCKSGSGSGSISTLKVRGSVRRSADAGTPGAASKVAGVRKTSGRVLSSGAKAIGRSR